MEFSKNNHFSFAISIANLFKLTKNESIYLFCNSAAGNILAANDLETELFHCSAENNLIGKNLYHDFQFDAKDQATLAQVIQHTMAGEGTIFEVQELAGKSFLGVHSQLKSSANCIVGITGIAFAMSQMNLKSILAILSKLNFQISLRDEVCAKYIHHSQKLSLREKECCKYIMLGLSAKEIARILQISYRTVEVHINNIKDKLGCSKSSQIVSKIFEEGFD